MRWVFFPAGYAIIFFCNFAQPPPQQIINGSSLISRVHWEITEIAKNAHHVFLWFYHFAREPQLSTSISERPLRILIDFEVRMRVDVYNMAAMWSGIIFLSED